MSSIPQKPPVEGLSLFEDTTRATMSSSHLIIHNAHNGHSIRVPKPLRFHTIASFKTFLYESFSNYLLGGTENIFLLTSFGIKFNFNMINELNDLYVYDKRLFSLQNNQQAMKIHEQYLNQGINNNSSSISVQKPPSLTNSIPLSVKNMSESLQRSANWCKTNLEISKSIDIETKSIIKQINIIFKCFNIIFLFGTNFINGIEKNFQNYFNYIKLTNMKTLHNNWKHYYKNLQKNFPVFKIKGKHGDNPSSDIVLFDMLQIEKLESSSEFVAEYLPKVVDRFNEMSVVINSVNNEKISIDGLIEKLRNESISKFKDNEKKCSQSIEEIEKVTKEFLADLDEITNNPSIGLKTLETVYRTAGYTNGNLYEYSNNLHDTLGELKKFRYKICEESLQIFSGVANLQMRMVSLKEELKKITGGGKQQDKTEENDDIISYETIRTIKKMEDYLSLTIDLPLLFGFMIIEKRRQYEWYDFYSKGVVKNISEQLSIMIEHEKVFRKLWIKKFGGFLSSLNDREEYLLNPKLPSIDVTLVNGDMENDEFSNILQNIQIQRKDILDYIEILKKYLMASVNSSPSSKNFVSILEKNFKDLLKSTSSMKRVTKLVCSMSTLTSPNSDELNNSKLDNQILAISQIGKNLGNGNSTLNGNGIANENDNDLDVIKGLKSRINKLENLLHQQQYKNLSQWPVTRNGESSSDRVRDNNDRFSLIIDRNQLPVPLNALKTPKINPTVFLQNSQRTITSPSPSNGSRVSSGEILDASTTIDKHLDNIRLRKENAELINVNRQLSNQNSVNEETIAKLKQEIDELKSNKVHLNEQLDSRDNKLKDKEQTISTLQNEITKYMGMNNDKFNESVKLNKVIEVTREELKNIKLSNDTLSEEIRDSKAMKNDLLSNMSAKELEFTKERNLLEEEIKSLRTKIDEVTDDYEDLMELTQAKQKGSEQLIDELNFIGNQLLGKVKEVINLSFNFYYDFCLILESMGLLLVKEYNEEKKSEELKIVRVKGLRSKKEKERVKNVANNLIDDAEHEEQDQDAPLTPQTKVLDDMRQLIDWVKELEVGSLPQSAFSEAENEDSSDVVASRDISVQENSISNQLSRVFKENFESRSGGSKSRYEELVKSLKNPTPKVDNSETSHTAFVAAISKRFRDVEGFAKKLTKENRSKSHELTKLSNKISSKISMNDFQVGDLVLFLPTRIDHMSEFQENFQPWAAFNFGSPHYFLKVRKEKESEKEEDGELLHDLKEKDWMVGRIVNITSHIAQDDTNPFQLSGGVSWYYVEATEVEF